MKNSDKIILDLCGGTGAWSEPYRNAGYTVHVITLPDYDVTQVMFYPTYIRFLYVNNISHKGNVVISYRDIYGILAAPPCTEFASSGARWWAKKSPDLLQDALIIVSRCIEIIIQSNPVFWVLENPVGRLKNVLGPPIMYFNPCDFGDSYTKKTCLWGTFKKPKKNIVKPTMGSKMHLLPGGPSEEKRKLRSITPPGFAQAFYESNK